MPKQSFLHRIHFYNNIISIYITERKCKPILCSHDLYARMNKQWSMQQSYDYLTCLLTLAKKYDFCNLPIGLCKLPGAFVTYGRVPLALPVWVLVLFSFSTCVPVFYLTKYGLTYQDFQRYVINVLPSTNSKIISSPRTRTFKICGVF